ncbi:MAG: hypothetical protein DRP12_00060 [Candidatus Aenigmatarchaeota archaeon]|nr:MAG: hypothetical protein DRP12_00060 [Candidatus Aenigmarchaeota archaeon]
MAVWSDDFSEDTSQNYAILWRNVTGGRGYGNPPESTSITVSDGYLTAEITNSGYCKGIVYLKAKPTVNPLTENFVIEVRGRSHGWDGFASGITLAVDRVPEGSGNFEKFIRFVYSTYPSPDRIELQTHQRTLVSMDSDVDTEKTMCTFGPWNKFRIEKDGTWWKFFFNDNLIWEGEIPEADEEMYIGFTVDVTSGESGWTAINTYDDYYFALYPFGEITNISSPSSAHAGDSLSVSVDVKNTGSDGTIWCRLVDTYDDSEIGIRQESYLASEEIKTFSWVITMPNRDLTVRVEAGHEE